MIKAILAISLGGALGSVLRWLIGLSFNNAFPTIPLGTLLVNLAAGYLIGVFIAFFSINSHIPPEWRLFIITGFLGGLSTFSTFSAEVTGLLQQGRLLWGMATVLVHVVGSICMTFLGIATVSLFYVVFK